MAKGQGKGKDHVRRAWCARKDVTYGSTSRADGPGSVDLEQRVLAARVARHPLQHLTRSLNE